MENGARKINYDDRDMTEQFIDEEEKIYLNEQQKKAVYRFGGCFFWIFTFPFIITGLVFLVVGTTQYFKAREKERVCTELVKGIMTYENVVEETMRDEYNNIIGKSKSYSGPRVVKYTYNGREYVYRSGYFEEQDHFELNEEVDVYVEPVNPDNSYVPSDKGHTSESWRELIIAGAIVSVLSVLVVVWNYWSTQKS